MRRQPIRALDTTPTHEFHNTAVRSGLFIAFIVTGVLDGVLSLVLRFGIFLKRGRKAKEGKEHRQKGLPPDMQPRKKGVESQSLELMTTQDPSILSTCV